MVNNYYEPGYFLENKITYKNRFIIPAVILTLLFFLNCKSKLKNDVRIPLKMNKVISLQWSDVFEDDAVIPFTFDDPDLEIYMIGTVLIGPTGDYFILDSKVRKVIRFDASGKFKQYIGRYGEGAGEYLIPACTFVDRNNNFYIYDVMRMLINKYRFPDYKFAMQIRIAFAIQDLILDGNDKRGFSIHIPGRI